jgi:hypothetical protein
MKTPLHRIILFLSLGALAAGGVSFWQSYHWHRSACAQRSQAIAEIEQLARKLSKLQSHARDSSVSNPVKTDNAVQADTVYKNLEADAKRNVALQQAKLYREPKIQALYQERERAREKATYRLLFRRLKLTREEQDALVAAHVDYTMLDQDISALAQDKGLPRNDPGLKAQRKEAEAKFMQQIEAVLGPDAPKVLRAYRETDGARSYVASFSGMLAGVDQPLTLDQADNLIQAMAESAPRSGNLLDKVTPEQWDQIFERSEKILSSAQATYFRTIAPPGEYYSRWSNELTALLSKTAGPGPL